MDTLTTKSGTSMATPAVAGEAAVIHSYFANGNYPVDGTNKTRFLPSSSLLKAIISCLNFGPNFNQISDYTNTENMGNAGPLLPQWVVETTVRNDIEIKPQTVHEYEYESQIGIDSIAISYLDPPSNNLFEDSHTLRAAVNLIVEDPEGKIYYGNEHANNIDEIYTTTSKVKTSSMAGTYKIYVISGPWDENDFKIEYSLAIYGSDIVNDINLKRVETNRTCPGNCNGNGECVNGRCICYENATGTACQMKVENYDTIELNGIFSGAISLDGYIWLSTNVLKGEEYTLIMYPNGEEMYDTFYKICVGEEKDTISNDKLQCYHSTFYKQEFGPIIFNTTKAYIAIVTTTRKNPIPRFYLGLTEHISENAGNILVNTVAFAILIVFLVIFIIVSIVLSTILLCKFCHCKREIESDSSNDFQLKTAII